MPTGADAAEAEVPLRRLVRWLVSQLPGRRHSTLLMRLASAEREYRHLDRHLHSLWRQAGPLPST